MEAVESVVRSSESVPKPRDCAHLKPWQFKAGVHNPARYDPKAHRPKGSKSFSTILVEAAPKLGKAYLREALRGSAPLLQDTRKIFMPIDSDAPVAQSTTLIAWLEQHTTTTPSVPAIEATASMPQIGVTLDTPTP
jgi:hypothetical protein